MATSPIVAIIAAGAMGGGVGKRMTESGCQVWTILEGRSEATKKRAEDAGMKESSVEEIVRSADFVLSILPPSDAHELARTFAEEVKRQGGERKIVYADCNAVSPETVKTISELFVGLKNVGFVDGSIIGGPPKGDYNPRLYASVGAGEEEVLGEFEKLKAWGIDVKPLKGDGVGVGDASALKMSYAGISKGLTGLFATMILGSLTSASRV
ncbi:hypothetical protein BDN72DRAFT_833013 [Pluteus cervinus]|uniref:Uncharacterized protein n=1 Tax=Pluteus cervinus TaxID=181527 RepID=A0ACD3BAC9_9AGAR|nr:hypothetical protein BDN72DRAFT_833013 [Pluteus cervinus]